MSPLKTLAFFISVLMVLFLMVLYFPKDGVRVGQMTLKFPTYADFLDEDTIIYADISEILENQENILNEIDSISPIADTLIKSDTINISDSISKKISYRKRKKVFRKIEFPENNPKALLPFYQVMLNAGKGGQTVRIMHYGDSQIEADRMTAYIRDRLQTHFGGSGPGLLPILQPGNFQFSIKQEYSGDWERYTAFGNTGKSEVKGSNFGALFSFSRFLPQEKTSHHCLVRFEESPYSYHSVRNFNRIQIFYGNNSHPLLYQIKGENGVLFDADIAQPESGLNRIVVELDTTVRDLDVSLESDSSFDIFGVSLDGVPGILVDNIPMRGSSGLVFTKVDQDGLDRMLNYLKPSMIILQFGGNVVPYIKGNAHKYGEWFGSQVKHIKQIMPGVPVLVIGVADMSVKEKGKYISYPGLIEVRDAMKKASLKAGAAYWDLFEAMGGENSMPSWVFAEPSLASTDFVHFNVKGSRIVAELFYDALMSDFDIYRKELLAGGLIYDSIREKIQTDSSLAFINGDE